MERSTLDFTVNGKDYSLSEVDVSMTMLEWLRSEGLTGTKLGCGEGGCGACTVDVQSFDSRTGVTKHASTNACLMPLMSADSCVVTTVEGIGSYKDGLHPIQQRMVDYHGSQCGYCTPGIVMAMYSNFAEHPNLTVKEVEEHMDGNLCRCTGYRPIWDAAKSLCADAHTCAHAMNVGDVDIEELSRCNAHGKDSTDNCGGGQPLQLTSTKSRMLESQPANKTPGGNVAVTERLFPEKYKTSCRDAIKLRGGRSDGGEEDIITWHRPDSLLKLLSIKSNIPAARIVVGNTEVGIEVKFRNMVSKDVVSTSAVPELNAMRTEGDFLFVGGSVNLSDVQAKCQTLMEESKVAAAIYNQLRWFASTQIRNAACLAGNIATASPISDMNPLLTASDAMVELSSLTPGGWQMTKRWVAVRDLWLGYRKTAIQPTEVISTVKIPLRYAGDAATGGEFEVFEAYKQARRREDDISIVTGGIGIRLRAGADATSDPIVTAFAMALGGMAPTTKLCPKVASFVEGKPWNEDTLLAALEVLKEEVQLGAGVPGGQPEFRMSLALSFLRKAFISARIAAGAECDGSELSGADSFLSRPKPSITGTQSFQPAGPSASEPAAGLEARADLNGLDMPARPHPSGETPVGRADPHLSAPLHVSGEAIYVDDMPTPPGLLHLELVLATRAHALVASLDTAEAEAVPGVVRVFTAEDVDAIGGDNTLGPIVHDEEVFARKKAVHHGSVLAAVVATSKKAAEAGARVVRATYNEVEAGDDAACGDFKAGEIITIQDAIKADSFYGATNHDLVIGEARSYLSQLEANADPDVAVVQGDCYVGGQEHFYLECMSTMCVPLEGGSLMDVYSSTQAPSKTQTYCASAAGLRQNQVVTKTKRMGGGFGGKETRAVFAAAAAAVAAQHLQQPVKVTLDRHVDMATTGQRHAFYAKYTAAANRTTGKVEALDVQLYSNGGSGLDLSGPVLDRALLHVDGCYHWPRFHAQGIVCRTNQPPHTAFRGFGGPQGIFVVETIMDHIASALSASHRVHTPESVRAANFYQPGHCVTFGTQWDEKDNVFNVPAMWRQLEKKASWVDRAAAVAAFNARNKHTKRGLAMVPTKFGINFTAKFMNQGGALVHVYTDGTVYVSHGGTEMGQGLHTKVAQIAAQAFGVPLEDVVIGSSDTDKVANGMPTAASMSNDLYGMATLDACHQILKRLEPIRASKGGASADWRDIVTTAYFSRVDLSAHGFYRVSDAMCGFDWDAKAPEGWVPGEGENAMSCRGRPFNYFTQGVACTEVEVDCLTGDHRVLRTDVVVDLGASMNPAIDVGQIEGAFTQGMGWATTEEIMWGDDEHPWIRPRGRLHTAGPGTYKIPSFNDTPEIFNVSLFEQVQNRVCVHSSKAVGEPPFFLGSSVAFAIRRALQSCRVDNGIEGFWPLHSPVTSERIRMSVGDDIAKGCVASVNGDEGVDAATFQTHGSF